VTLRWGGARYRAQRDALKERIRLSSPCGAGSAPAALGGARARGPLDVLAQTRTVQQRLRDLPSRSGVYFVFDLGLFLRIGYARVSA
jgi:hypothetical protein